MLIHAFAGDILDRVKIEPLRKALETRALRAAGEGSRGGGQTMTPLAVTSAPAGTSGTFDVARVRADFPILKRTVRGKPLVYLDNAATTQKPQAVLDALTHYYTDINANVHRGVHELSGLATDAYEGAREVIRGILQCAKRPGDRLHAKCHREHQPRRVRLRPSDAGGRRRGRDLGDGAPLEHRAVAARLRGEGRAPARGADRRSRRADRSTSSTRLIGPRTKIVSIAHMSNALGTINPVAEIVAFAHSRGVPVLIDGSQAAYHMPVDVQALGCDFYAATGHKLYGPTGIGVLDRHVRSVWRRCRRSWAAET